MRTKRSLWISLLVVLVFAFGAFGAALASGWSPKLGLDLAGGLSLTYTPTNKAQVNATDLATTVQVMDNRVNALGVSGATVGSQGDNIVVSVPGVTKAQEIEDTVGETGQLFFRPVLCEAPAYTQPKKGVAPPTTPLPTSCGSTYEWTESNLGVTPSSSAAGGFTENSLDADPSLASYPTTTSTGDTQGATVLLANNPQNGGGSSRYLLGPAPLTGKIIKSASAQIVSGQWVVAYTLTGPGSSAWETMAQQSFHQAIAIDLDGVVESAPIIDATDTSYTSFGGQGQISGNFTSQSAHQLATVLQYGSIPLKLKALDTEQVSPTLGKSSLRAGLLAGIGGLLLVLLYVIAYYRALGVVVVAGLVTTAALLWFFISLAGVALHLTLDLAGITGIIVSIGITVDSYIVYFERLKDEARAGRTVRTSVDRGFKSAFRTVLAADSVSLIGAFLLWWISIGPVRGFAFFLGLSTLLDVFVTYFFTRPLVVLLGRNERVAGARRFGVARGLAAEQQGAVA